MSKNIYDEKVYLSRNIDALQYFEQLKQEKQKTCKKELSQYKDILEEYKKFIITIGNLLRIMNLHTPIEYSIALKYLKFVKK